MNYFVVIFENRKIENVNFIEQRIFLKNSRCSGKIDSAVHSLSSYRKLTVKRVDYTKITLKRP